VFRSVPINDVTRFFSAILGKGWFLKLFNPSENADVTGLDRNWARTPVSLWF
jgi:hypothetical protein